MKYPHLLQEGKLGTYRVKNRIVLAPMGDNMAGPDGGVSEQCISFYEKRAEGGAGIIMIGAVPVDYRLGRAQPNALRIDRARDVAGLYELTRRIHAHGALVIPQLGHSGPRTKRVNIDGETPVCVSDVQPEAAALRRCLEEGLQHVLTTEETRDLIPAYVHAAQQCQRGGCDGVEIHMVHGYLLNAFLSPDTNHRQDIYGGSLENRLRLPVQIIKAVRKACGRQFLVMARIPGVEFIKNGITQDDVIRIAQAMEEAGCDALSISIGMTADQTKIKEPEGSPEGTRIEWAARIREAVSVPVMTSGVLKTPGVCERVLAENKVDFVLLARQMVCDPMWPQKVLEGREDTIRPCLNCNMGCFINIDKGYPLGCVLNPEAGAEYRHVEETPSEVPGKVMVIGGGISGMQAAITASKRGNQVSLYEKTGNLGGQMLLAAVPPGKTAVARAREFFIEEMKRRGVAVVLNVEVTQEVIKAEAPDTVIMLPGGQPFAPAIPGIELGAQAWDLLSGETEVPKGKKLAVLGGGLVGCETALFLSEKGNDVCVLEMMPAVAQEMEGANREQLMRNLDRNKIRCLTEMTVLRIEEGAVFCRNSDGIEQRIEADLAVYAFGQKTAGDELRDALEELKGDIRVLAGTAAPSNFAGATKLGYDLASVI